MVPVPTKIRPAVPGDAAALVELNNRLVAETEFMVLLPIDPATGVHQVRALLESLSRGAARTILLAEAEGRLTGLAVGTADMNPRYRGTVEVEVGVVAEAWGRGVGRALMEALEGVWLARGARRFQLRVLAHNERAVRLYERLGYAHEGRLRGNVTLSQGFADQLLMGKLVGG
ncbi:MAG TPA: GNAT family protein [Azospirillaceae bacterium]|nr:GNAT family protein [Azospirillaceae bacterium]